MAIAVDVVCNNVLMTMISLQNTVKIHKQHPRGGGGGYSDIWVWVFRKINSFWGLKILWIFFWGHHKIGLYLEVISMHFKVFS